MPVDPNNQNIILNRIEAHEKATETYADVTFLYPNNQRWDGYIPLEYRRTAVAIAPGDIRAVFSLLEFAYVRLEPSAFRKWALDQKSFWDEHPKAGVTRAFFDVLAEGGWKCVNCDLPRNANPARRLQDIKEFGYTFGTAKSRYCPTCQRNTAQRILIPFDRTDCSGNGYEGWSAFLRERILRVLGRVDAYENRVGKALLPDHKFSEIRWDANTKEDNPDDMSESDIKAKFQLLTNQRNQQKREVCRRCLQTGERGYPFGIKFFYSGGPMWPTDIPKTGRAAKAGCYGCGWYDIAEWREKLNELLSRTQQEPINSSENHAHTHTSSEPDSSKVEALVQSLFDECGITVQGQ